MKFGEALRKMAKGQKVQRKGWNGKNMFLFQIAGNDWDFETDVSGADGIETDPFICMRTASNTLVPWLASQSDVIVDDWDIVG